MLTLDLVRCNIIPTRMLHLSGYSVSLDDLKSFRQLDSITPGNTSVNYELQCCLSADWFTDCLKSILDFPVNFFRFRVN